MLLASLVSESGRFSGVNRPGLIEARRKSSSARTATTGFPGLIAPASLKVQNLALRSAGRRVFSGVNRPGLIEG